MAYWASRTIPAYRQLSRREHFSKGFTIVELLIVIVVIAILAAITIVAYNGITDRAKESARVSELAQWKKTAELYKVQNNIECPEGYVFIYGNSTLGTSDFCVTKYEVKIEGNDVGTTTYSAAMTAESRASGTPWVNITQPQAITEAAEAGGHLVTEPEWMTIAADVLSVKYNWSGGAVGSGFIYQGHVNNNPSSALAASADDTDVLSGMTGGIGQTSGMNNSRVLYLKSGDAIWDLAGNVWEWTNATITGAQPGASGYSWREYPSITNWGNLPAVSRPSALASIPGLGSVTSWDSSNGVSRIYSNSGASGELGYLRSGVWNLGINTGILSLALNTMPSGLSVYTGFRVAR